MKIYDLSQPLNQDVSFWPFYPPFEVKYIKRKSEHGVNAQYIQTSNHMGTHLDAPRHFVTGGMTIDEIPIEWCYGPGVIVNLSDAMDELELFTPAMLEERVEIREGDILYIHTGWHKYGQFGTLPDEEKYIHRHPGPHFDIVPWLLEKKIHIWGVDMISTDHPMNLPIGRFLGKGGLEHWKKVRNQCEEKFGEDNMDELFPDSAYQLTHNALFPENCMHVENLGGDIGAPELQNRRITLGVFPWKFRGGRRRSAEQSLSLKNSSFMQSEAREPVRIIFPGLWAALILVFGVSACSSNNELPSDSDQTSTNIVMDEVCQEALNTTFLSEESILLGETQEGFLYGPIKVSFLNNGRVMWRYSIEPVFGTFTCTDGFFEADFSEGENRSFEGEYNSVSMTLSINGSLFIPETDE